MVNNVLLFFVQTFKQNPQHFHGFFQRIMEISLADEDVCMILGHRQGQSIFNKINTKILSLFNFYYWFHLMPHFSISVYLLWPVAAFFFQVLSIREQSIILVFLIHCFNSLVCEQSLIKNNLAQHIVLQCLSQCCFWLTHDNFLTTLWWLLISTESQKLTFQTYGICWDILKAWAWWKMPICQKSATYFIKLIPVKYQVSFHAKTCYLHTWKDHGCYGYMMHRAFRSKKNVKWNGLAFHWCLYNK